MAFVDDGNNNNALEPTLSTSASASRDHDDLDPAAFLKTVRELSEKREREDAERYRKLEEEVEKSRAERAARRSGMLYSLFLGACGGAIFFGFVYIQQLREEAFTDVELIKTLLLG